MTEDEQYLTGRFTRQRTLLSRDFSWLEAFTTSIDASTTWRYRGITPNPESFARNIWAGASVQHVVESRKEPVGSEPIGLLTAYRTDYRSRTAFLAALFDRNSRMTGLPIEAAFLFVEHCFSVLALRKLYVESLTSSWANVATLSKIGFRVEGRLEAYELINGSYEDLVIAAIDQESWRLRAPRYRKLFLCISEERHL